jgi:hypothetical protein
MKSLKLLLQYNDVVFQTIFTDENNIENVELVM